MMCPFDPQDIERLAQILGATLTRDGNTWSFEQRSSSGTLEQQVTIYPSLATPDGERTLVTVQSRTGFHQLFGCEAALVIEPDEILFIAREGKTASCLLIGAQRVCSLYANVPMSLLQQKLDELDPAALLAVMQLSLAEQYLIAETNGQ
jgi:hypothetical protein